MTILVALVIAISIICILLVLQFKNNKNKLKMKIECGKTIWAKVILWDVLPGRPTLYVVKVEYEIDEKKEKKTFITSGKYAKKYEQDRNIQIVIIQNSNKFFLDEEDWKIQNIIIFVFLIYLIQFLLMALLMGFMEIIELRG